MKAFTPISTTHNSGKTLPATQPKFETAMLHPKYWITWLGLGLGWLAAKLPYGMQISLGRLIGKLIFRTSGRRVHIARTNLKLCFPDMSDAEREKLLSENFESMGIAVMEVVMSWWSSDKQLKQLVKIEGLHHLQEALALDKGVILLSAHFTTMEIGGRLLSLFSPFHPLYRQHKNPVFEYVMHKSRSRHTQKAIERGNMREMVRSLRKKMAVWYAPDQDYGMEKSIFVNFFNVPAATITATIRLAQLNNSPVVPFFQRRLDNNQGYLLSIYPAVENFPSDDIYADTQRINQIIEDEILKMPEQYLWAHRRFKNRPDNSPDVY